MKKRITFLKIFLLLLLIIIVTDCHNQDISTETDFVVLLDDFHYQRGDSPVDENTGNYKWITENDVKWLEVPGSRLLFKKETDEYLWYKIHLPDRKLPNPYLILPHIETGFEVFYGCQRLYSHGALGSENKGSNLWKWHYVQLPLDYTGKAIYIRVFSSRDEQIGITGNVYLSSLPFYIIKLFIDNLFPLMIGFLSLMIGLIRLINYLILKEAISSLYFSLMTIAFGMMVITTSEIFIKLFRIPPLDYIGSVVGLFAPVFMYLFFDSLFRSKQKYIYKFLWIVHLVFGISAVTAVALSYTDLELRNAIVNLFSILMFNTTVFMIIASIRLWIIGGNEAKIYTIGFIIFGIFFVRDSFVTLGLIESDELLSYYGLFLLIITNDFVLRRRLIKDREQLSSHSKELELYRYHLEDIVRQRTEALQSSEKRYRAIVEDQTEFICRFKPDITFTFANDAYCKYLNLEYDNIIGEKSFLPVIDEDTQILNNALKAVSKENRAITIEVRIKLYSKLILWNQWTIRGIFDEEGKLTEFQCVGQDITDRKQAEEELLKANDEIKRFAYIVSHDLRSPLINLKGFSKELQNYVNEIKAIVMKEKNNCSIESSEMMNSIVENDIPESIDFINASIERMDTFINSVLKLSRIGNRELILEQLDLNGIVDNILKSLNHQLDKHNTKVILNKLPKIFVDRISIEQIFGNIITNAVNYLDSSRDGFLEIGYEDNLDSYTFYVKDNGVGISEKNKEKVFELFRRAGKHKNKGEGMGMAYVQAIIRRFGGKIWFDSEFGVGSTFYFSVPKKIE